MPDEDNEIRARLERDGAYWIDASILHDLEMGKACEYGQRTAAKMLRSRGDWIVHAESEIERLRKERDEARRMWCEAAPVGNSLSVDDINRRARAEAERRGWDCFKESSNDR